MDKQRQKIPKILEKSGFSPESQIAPAKKLTNRGKTAKLVIVE